LPEDGRDLINATLPLIEEQIVHGLVRRQTGIWSLLVSLSFLVVLLVVASPVLADEGPALAGGVLDEQEEPVRGAEVALYLDGEPSPVLQQETDHLGHFVLDLPAPPSESAYVVISHPHFESATQVIEGADLAVLQEGGTVRVPDIALARQISAGFWIAILIFAGMLFLIISEALHTTAAALLAAASVLTISLVGQVFDEGLYIIGFEQAIEYVDFEVIFLVLGMMIIVGTIERTGIFQWAAYQAYRISRGRLWLLAVILMVLTSVASALLDNVTTMLLMAPITLQIALTLRVDPLALLIPEMLASNVGGISTLIGTPNNILIGSYAGLGFNDFLSNLTPGVLLVQVALTLYVIWVFRGPYRGGSGTDSGSLLALLKEHAQITEPVVLRKAGIVFLATLLLFIFGERFHLVPAVTAMIGGAATLVVVRADVEEILHVVDWTTLLFFIALFMVIGALQEVGLISLIGSGIHSLVGENLTAATLITIWGTAMVCLLIPTVPLTAALLPVVGFLSRSIPGAGSNVLYYSLSMGSALGANNSLIGATNNMVSAGIAQRAGFPITYRAFIKVGFPAAVITLVVGTLWILIRF
jgi:Na+/H+ antiporter NhaD/arsenite permease-like protein